MSCELPAWQASQLRLSASIARASVSLLRRRTAESTVSTIAVTPACSARRTIASVTAKSSVGYSCCHSGAPRASVTASTGKDPPVESIICVPRVFAARATASSPSGWNARCEETAEI